MKSAILSGKTDAGNLHMRFVGKRACALFLSALLAGTAGAVWHPGLMSGTVTGQSKIGNTYPATTNIVSSPVMAKTSGWGSNINYVYWGQIYLDGSTYNFAESIDDATWLKIDGTVVLNNTAWNQVGTGSITREAGWYDFEVRFFNAGGGGPVNSDGWGTKTFGFGYNTSGYTGREATGYVFPEDNGHASLFRYDDGIGVDCVIVSGFPKEVAAEGMSHGYGSNSGFTKDQRVEFFAPEDPQPVSDVERAICTGWKLYKINGDTGAREFWREGTGCTVSDYSHPDSVVELEWQWRIEYLVSATAGTGGSVEPETSWVAPGDEITITSTPDSTNEVQKWTATGVTLPTRVGKPWRKMTFMMPSNAVNVAVSFCLKEIPQPGLKQYRLKPVGNNQYLTDANWTSYRDSSVAVAVMPGALMVKPANFSGTTWNGVNYPFGNNSGYWYEGYIKLEAGKTYSGASFFDDGGCVYIEGQRVYNQGTSSGYNGTKPSFTPQPFVCTKTGWYFLQVGIWDWGGGRGCYGGTIAGVQWSDADPAEAVKDYSAKYWKEFWDADENGEPAGTYLYTACPIIPDRMAVIGELDESGTPIPNERWFDVTPGVETNLTVTGETTTATNGVCRYTCIGWQLTVTDLDGNETITTGTADELDFHYLPQEGDCAVLEWLWKTEYLVTVTAGTGGTASPAETWVENGNGLPISAEAFEGYAFYRWSGDASDKDAAINLTVDGPKSVTALFASATRVTTKEEFTTALDNALARVKAGEIGAVTIWLADGNYQLAAKTTIDVPIKIRSESDDPAKVIFTPSGKSGHEMFVLAHADAGLYGLTIKGGTGTGGQSYTTYGCAQGADVTITTAGGKVENCILCGASASSWGACASALKQGAGLVSRCVISNNTSSCAWDNAAYNTYGCAAIVYGGVIENTLITKNSTGGSDAGGGAICMTGTGTMINCTVAGNTMNGYAGVFFNSKTAKAVNCLICNNTSSHRTENYAGVYNGSSYASYFTACVAPVQINGSCHTAAGLGLKDAGHGDYHPILGSVCLDNGTLDGITPSALDLDGNARIDEDSGKIDVGCYELNLEGIAASVTCTPADTQGLVPVTRTFSSIVQGGTPTAYEWSINGEVLSGETGESFSRTFTKAGSYTVSLKVSDAKGTYDAVNDILITAFPTNVYVDATSATPVAPYDTPETAAKTFADAYAAAGDYSVILVAPNTYERTSQITISKKVTVRGTGKSPLDTRFVLKNASNTRVMQFNCKEALVCNLTLEGGWVNTQNGKGGGVYIADKGGTVSNCVIRSCKCGAGDECGGGAFLGCADACITHCVFTNCSVVGESCGQNAWARGGFAASITAGTLRDSLIVGCYQNGFNKNYPGDDGAVAMHGGKLVNCTIVGCRAEECAGIRAEGGQVINCIVSGNTTTSTNPTNAVWRGSGTTVRNSLADQDVGGKFASEETALTFVGTGTHRYRLRAGSKAIDAGDASEVTSTVDLRGNPRVQCGAVDLGCYEARVGLTILVK